MLKELFSRIFQKKVLKKFIIIGFTTVLIDLLVYLFLIKIGLIIKGAKAISFLSGALFSYQANRLWTFKIQYFNTYQIISFMFLYFTSLYFNVTLNSFFISIFKYPLSLHLSFIFATSISATYNFLGLRLFVFNRNLNKDA